MKSANLSIRRSVDNYVWGLAQCSAQSSVQGPVWSFIWEFVWGSVQSPVWSSVQGWGVQNSIRDFVRGSVKMEINE